MARQDRSATLALEEAELTGVDALPHDFKRPQGFFVLLHPTTTDESERVFDQLADEGQVLIPMQEAFWTPRYGSVVDRFGIPWEISCEAAD